MRERHHAHRLADIRGVECDRLLGRERVRRPRQVRVAAQNYPAGRDDLVVDEVARTGAQQFERRRWKIEERLAFLLVQTLGDHSRGAEQHAILLLGGGASGAEVGRSGVQNGQHQKRNQHPAQQLGAQAFIPHRAASADSPVLAG